MSSQSYGMIARPRAFDLDDVLAVFADAIQAGHHPSANDDGGKDMDACFDRKKFARYRLQVNASLHGGVRRHWLGEAEIFSVVQLLPSSSSAVGPHYDTCYSL